MTEGPFERYHMQRTVEFAAAHRLTKFPQGHKCNSVHGHNYIVEVELSATCLDDLDVLTDFGEIDDAIRKRFDHKNLNDFPEFKDNPTSELLARRIADLLMKDVVFQKNVNVPVPDQLSLDRVRVYESPKSWAEWRKV